ncbi:SBBP repeat-containing protein [Nannocystis punicea]|uniref:SBBP repeat-containing protein n=1 Tax=Nannocystis punicea TaxID=2995304 RepID=A0ABY7HB82_9BACT|nr:SBBP repeat-containing protein [Nannocystis poenicansa]WAS96502.1 SBBP repeat-containing protein [Nannocystis poenicansa]
MHLYSLDLSARTRRHACFSVTLAALVAAVPEAHALPDLTWSTYYGADPSDAVNDVDFDVWGELVSVGYTFSESEIAGGDAFDPDYDGDADGFVTKFDAFGDQVWGTYLGGSGPDYLHSVASDANDGIIVVGVTSSTSDIATIGADQTILSGTSDGMVAKYDGEGELQWATYIGGNGVDGARGVCLAADGTIYVVGRTTSNSGLAVGTVHDSTFNGVQDAFVAKLASVDGDVLWTTYFGGNGTTEAFDCAVDSNGNIFVTGYTNATDIATVGTHDAGANGGQDAFLAKFTSSGGRSWATFYGGAGDDHGNAVIVDGSNNVYIAGDTKSANGGLSLLIATTADTSLDGTQDAFVAKFSNGGVRSWGRYFGGAPGGFEYEGFYDLEVFATGLYLSGRTTSSGLATANAFDATHGGGYSDAVFVAIDATNGSLFHASYLGGTSYDAGHGVAIRIGEAAIGGTTGSPSGVATAGAHDATYDDGYDGLIAWIHLFDV